MSEIIDGDPESISKEADMLAEIAQFNYRTIKGFRKTSFRKKSPHKESPHIQYVSIRLYGIVISRTLFDVLYSLGLVIHYNRIRQLINNLVATASQQYLDDGAVIPMNLLLGLILIFERIMSIKLLSSFRLLMRSMGPALVHSNNQRQKILG